MNDVNENKGIKLELYLDETILVIDKFININKIDNKLPVEQIYNLSNFLLTTITECFIDIFHFEQIMKKNKLKNLHDVTLWHSIKSMTYLFKKLKLNKKEILLIKKRIDIEECVKIKIMEKIQEYVLRIVQSREEF